MNHDETLMEITRKHGLEMRKLALQHSLEMAKIYRDSEFEQDALSSLIEYLETKLKEESEDEN